MGVLLEEDRKNILSSCGFDEMEIGRFYVELNIENSEKVTRLSQGDSGALWVLEIFRNNKLSEGLKKYEPGYYEWNYPVYVLDGENKFSGEVSGRIMISDEF